MALSPKRFWRKLAILAKIETDYGVDATPTGAANAIQASEVSLTPLAGEEVKRDLMLPYLGNQGSILVGDYVELQGQVEIAGAGAAGTVPGYGVLLRACTCAETIEAGTSVTYEFTSSGEESATLYANLDGVLHKLLGARGTATLNIAPKQIPRFTFTVRGLLVPAVDAALPAVTLTLFQTPLNVSKANTPTFSLHGYNAIAESLSLDFGNTIEVRNLIGEDSIQRTDRQSTGTMVLEAKSIATKDWFAIARSHAVGPLSVVHGTTAGNIVEFAAPAVQIGRPTYGNTQGITNMSLPLMLKPVTGDDELAIIVR